MPRRARFAALVATVNPKRPNEVYVATMEGKIFRSADGDATWGP
jgi:inosine/xanthosine triphosphate pyrophosphatase family protein